jgi:hypothetical protein
MTVGELSRDVLSNADCAILQCYSGVDAFTHPFLGPALAMAVNEWLAEEWLAQDERLMASAVITPHHVDAAVEEIVRVSHNPRFCQILLPSRAEVGYGDQRFWPILECAADRGLAIGITAGGALATAPTPVNWMSSFFEDYATLVLAFQSHLASLVASGVFVRWPHLRVVMMETGWTWLPALLWRMDAYWKGMQRELPWLAEPPSAYVMRHARFTTTPVDGPTVTSQGLGPVVNRLRPALPLLFGSDYPHRCGGTMTWIETELTQVERENVRWRNAAEWYRVTDRMALRPRANL